MDYPFYTLCYANPAHVPDAGPVFDHDLAETVINVQKPTFDQMIMASMAIYQESVHRATIVKNRFGWQDAGHKFRPSDLDVPDSFGK